MLTIFLTLVTSGAGAQSGACDQCDDLPRLEQHLRELEWLHRARQKLDGRDPLTASTGEPSVVQEQIDSALARWLQSPAGVGGGLPKPLPITVDLTQKECPLLSVVAEQGVIKTDVFDANKYKEALCEPLADAFLQRERKRQALCQQTWSQGRAIDFGYADYVAAMEGIADGVAINALKLTIARMSKQCQGVSEAAPAGKTPAALVDPFADGLGVSGEPDRLLMEVRRHAKALDAPPCAAEDEACWVKRLVGERNLYLSLRKMGFANAKPDRPVLRVAAAKASHPQLRAFAIETLGKSLQPGEGPLIVEGLDHVYPLVRTVSLRQVPRVGDPKYLRYPIRQAKDVDTSVGGLIETTALGPENLGVALPPDAKFRPSGSGPWRAFFTTALSTDDAVKQISENGKRPVYTLAEIRHRQQEALKTGDPLRLVGAMGKQVSETQRALVAMHGGVALARIDWSDGFEQDRTVSDLKYVQIDAVTVNGTALPRRIALVFKDEIYGQTAIVFPFAAEAARAEVTRAAAAARLSAEDLKRRQRIAQMISVSSQ